MNRFQEQTKNFPFSLYCKCASQGLSKADDKSFFLMGFLFTWNPKMLNFTSECNVWLHIPKRNNWPLFQLYFHALITGIAVYPAAMLSNSLYHGSNNGRAKDWCKNSSIILMVPHRPATFCLSLFLSLLHVSVCCLCVYSPTWSLSAHHLPAV